MKAADIDLVQWLEFLPESGRILLNDQRMLLFSQSALGTLNELVVSHLGHQFAAAIFTQFGFRCGRDDYRSVAADGPWDSELDRISSGPVMHMWEGIVHVTPTLLEYDRDAGHFHMAGEWRNSYEAQNYLRRYGVGDECVCWALTGYASGWATEFLGADVLAIETSCLGRGDDLCRFEIRPPVRWDSRADPWRRALVATPESVTSYMEAKVAERTAELSETNRRLAAARDAAERANAVKAQFLANVSHELRTPLNGVIGLAEVLGDTDLDDEQRRLLDLIIRAAERQMSIVTDILDFTSIESGKRSVTPGPLAPADLLNSVAQHFGPMCAAKELTMTVAVAPDVPGQIECDATMLRQVLSALTSNAVKFTPPSGSVTLAAELRGGELAISVRDDGIGMDPDKAQAYFEPFTQGDPSATRQFGGTGLGLAISRELCSLLGARLEVDTAPGEGSTFTVLMPTRIEPPPEEAPLRVLIADDNQINAIVITKLLENLGCEVTATEGGAEAIAAFDAGDFDLAVLDLHMPEVDGIAVVEHIRASERAAGTPPLLVAALTADALPDTRDRCLAAGFSEFLTKPVRKDVVAGLVSRATSVLTARRQP